MLARTLPYFMVATILVMAAVLPASAAVEVGKPAPAIQATDINGNEFNLSDHQGKIVVLEWTNHDCPFVVKHYDSGNMQKLQNEAREMGVEWVTIVSSAPGKQGHVSAEEAMKIMEEAGANPTTKILDESGEIGKAYDAKTTPHMFVIDEDGNVAYAGAIDSDSSPRQSAIEGADNYVMAAVESLKAGEEVAVKTSAPYGCSVKY
ncbi:MAG: redoxin family protein [Alphaproteobacteria bacterium]